jgi:RNA methyltransferase, TrmH family
MEATKRQLSMLRSLRSRKGRRDTGLFLLEGVRLCGEALEGAVEVEAVLVDSALGSDSDAARIALALEARGARLLHGKTSLVQSVSDTVQSQGIVAAARWKDAALADLDYEAGVRILALDRVSDPGNVGTIIRTAAWFGMGGIILSRECADILNPKVVRSTMGGLFHLPIVRDIVLSQAVPELKSLGFRVSAAVLGGTDDYHSWAESDRSLLLLGSEAHGIDDALLAHADTKITIPKRGKGESLNVAITAGILMAGG